MEIRVLGPIEADHGGHTVGLGGPKQRLVLAVLTAHVNEVVSTDRLVEEVWAGAPPPHARRTLQAYVANLRAILEPCRPGTLRARRSGYVIELDDSVFDSLRFESLVRKGLAVTAAEPDSASELLGAAERLWRGEAYQDLSDAPSLILEINRLAESRLFASEARLAIDLATGRHSAAVPELEALVQDHPFRENLRAQLMTALNGCGRQADALRVYQQARRLLAEEFGTDPSPALEQLEEQILLQNAGLHVRPYRNPEVVARVRYVETPDRVSIAYCTVGSDGLDLVYIPGWISNIETMWEHELPSKFLRGLASFSRLICFDKRGTGLSDRLLGDDLPGLEARADDIRVVLDASGSERAVQFGCSDGGPLAVQFAATCPERCVALILYGSFATRRSSSDYPCAPSAAARQRWLEYMEREWGGEADLRTLAPSLLADASFREYWAHYLRSGASPGAVAALESMDSAVDVRSTVASIDVPTLVLHRTRDRAVPVEGSRWLASHIPGAQLIEFEGEDHLPLVSSDEILGAIRAFLVGLSLVAPDHP